MVKNFFKFLIVTFLVLLVLSFVGGVVRIFKEDEQDFSHANIGVIEIKGIITESLNVLEQIDDFKENSQLKALVVRVDSPGGAVGASQEIFWELKKLKAEHPVIISMGDLAASGGLYISLAGTSVLALPGTLTGSMGVLFQMTNVSRLMEKILVDPVTIRSGDLKDAGNPLRPMDAKSKKLFEDLVQSTFEFFRKDVTSERKLKPEAVQLLSDGRVVNGEQALKLGLIDALGTFQDAVKTAAEKAKISGKPKLAFLSRKPKSLIERVLAETLTPVRELVQSRLEHLQYLWEPRF